MDEMQIRGLAMMLTIVLVVMLVTMRRQPRAIWMFTLALVGIGLGYLATTPTPKKLAETVFGNTAPAQEAAPATTKSPAQ